MLKKFIISALFFLVKQKVKIYANAIGIALCFEPIKAIINIEEIMFLTKGKILILKK